MIVGEAAVGNGVAIRLKLTHFVSCSYERKRNVGLAGRPPSDLKHAG